MPQDTSALLDRIHAGDETAIEPLLARHRRRLRGMISVRLDDRLLRRLDPSDIVQDVLLEASRQLPAYLEERKLPFYPWLRQLAWKRVIRLQRQHIRTSKRDVRREQHSVGGLPEHSSERLIDRLIASGTGPHGHLEKRERQEKLWQALEQLPPEDQEVLALKYVEQLATAEIAAVLELGESAVKMRHLRALKKLRNLLDEDARP